MNPSSPALSLDHVVIGVSDLEEASTALSALLGRGPSWRGRHPLYGTANVLYRLENAYLELLAPDPQAEGSGGWTAHLQHHLADRGDGLFAVAFSAPDVDATVEAIRGRGLPVDDAAEGTGVDLITGAERRWSNARVPPKETGGTSCFFIEHRSPPDALPPAPLVGDAASSVANVQALSIETADAAAARKLWRDQAGLAESATEDGWRYSLSNAALLLWAGAGEPDAPHHWQRLILGVPSVTALADRLDRQRLDFKQGSFREGNGICADCCGVSVLLTDA